jgi:hypothetical protein
MTHVFERATGLAVAVDAEGLWITDAGGHRYLDAAAGAIVNGVGHGRARVIEAIADQLGTVDYVHAHTFTTAVVDEYATALAAVLPVADARVFPVSGGSEAVETAIKLARAYHLARGEAGRTEVLARSGSYHGNTLGALDASGRPGLRRGYEPWLGRFTHVPPAYEYRCPNPDHPRACGMWHAARLEETILRLGQGRVAAFMAEPIGGATLGATVPTADYWPAIHDVCRRHGVLLVVDEVMTGFGRTGRWFGIEHFGVTPDIVVMAKGASSGYWPLGVCAAAGVVASTAAPVFEHGFTYSHHPAGAATGLAVLRIIAEEGLVERSARMGELLAQVLGDRLGGHPHVGDIRGRGLLVGIELVEDRATRRPFPREADLTERVRAAGLARGVTTYPVTGTVDGTLGDGLLLGPPLVATEDELVEIVTRVAGAVEDTLP